MRKRGAAARLVVADMSDRLDASLAACSWSDEALARERCRDPIRD